MRSRRRGSDRGSPNLFLAVERGGGVGGDGDKDGETIEVTARRRKWRRRRAVALGANEKAKIGMDKSSKYWGRRQCRLGPIYTPGSLVPLGGYSRV
jgi:hypothetical protein